MHRTFQGSPSADVNALYYPPQPPRLPIPARYKRMTLPGEAKPGPVLKMEEAVRMWKVSSLLDDFKLGWRYAPTDRKRQSLSSRSAMAFKYARAFPDSMAYDETADRVSFIPNGSHTLQMRQLFEIPDGFWDGLDLSLTDGKPIWPICGGICIILQSNPGILPFIATEGEAYTLASKSGSSSAPPTASRAGFSPKQMRAVAKTGTPMDTTSSRGVYLIMYDETSRGISGFGGGGAAAGGVNGRADTLAQEMGAAGRAALSKKDRNLILADFETRAGKRSKDKVDKTAKTPTSAKTDRVLPLDLFREALNYWGMTVYFPRRAEEHTGNDTPVSKIMDCIMERAISFPRYLTTKAVLDIDATYSLAILPFGETSMMVTTESWAGFNVNHDICTVGKFRISQISVEALMVTWWVIADLLDVAAESGKSDVPPLPKGKKLVPADPDVKYWLDALSHVIASTSFRDDPLLFLKRVSTYLRGIHCHPVFATLRELRPLDVTGFTKFSRRPFLTRKQDPVFDHIMKVCGIKLGEPVTQRPKSPDLPIPFKPLSQAERERRKAIIAQLGGQAEKDVAEIRAKLGPEAKVRGNRASIVVLPWNEAAVKEDMRRAVADEAMAVATDTSDTSGVKSAADMPASQTSNSAGRQDPHDLHTVEQALPSTHNMLDDALDLDAAAIEAIEQGLFAELRVLDDFGGAEEADEEDDDLDEEDEVPEVEDFD